MYVLLPVPIIDLQSVKEWMRITVDLGTNKSKRAQNEYANLGLN